MQEHSNDAIYSRMCARVDAALRAVSRASAVLDDRPTPAASPQEVKTLQAPQINQAMFELRGPLAVPASDAKASREGSAAAVWRTSALALVAAIVCTVWAPNTEAAQSQRGAWGASGAKSSIAAKNNVARAAGPAWQRSAIGPRAQQRQISLDRMFTGGYRLGLPAVKVRTLNGDLSSLHPIERVRLCQQVARHQKLSDAGLDWRHVYAVIHAESAWASQDGMGHNGKISRGISQLEDATAQALGVRDSYDPYEASSATAKLLKEATAWSQSRKHPAQSRSVALSVHYNLSTAARNAWDGKSVHTLPPETQRHVANVQDGLQYADYLGKQYERWLRTMGQAENASVAIRMAERQAELATGAGADLEREDASSDALTAQQLTPAGSDVFESRFQAANGPQSLGRDTGDGRHSAFSQAAREATVALATGATRSSAVPAAPKPGEQAPQKVGPVMAWLGDRGGRLVADTDGDDEVPDQDTAWAQTLVMAAPYEPHAPQSVKPGPVVLIKRLSVAFADTLKAAVAARSERLQGRGFPSIHDGGPARQVFASTAFDTSSVGPDFEDTIVPDQEDSSDGAERRFERARG
jgi:hypothetical protein